MPIILAAAQAGVDYLVSTDLDLTAEGETTQKLRDWMSPAQVMKVGAFLHEVMGWDSQELLAISRRRWDEITDSWLPAAGRT